VTRKQRAEWIASFIREECNCLEGTLDHDNCVRILEDITGAELLSILYEGLEEEEP